MNTTMRMKAIPYERAPQAKEGVLFEEIVTVRRIIITSAMLIIFALMALGISTAQGMSGTWHSSFESAARTAQRQAKPLFVLIAKAGCPACAEMERNLSHPSSGRALNSAIKARVESSANPNLTSRFASGGTPTTVIFAPGNYQNPVYTYTGVMDPGTISQVGRSLRSMK